MERKVASVVCFAIVAAACGTAPTPAPEFAAAPMAEMAPVAGGVMPAAEIAPVDEPMPMVVMPPPAEAPTEAQEVAQDSEPAQRPPAAHLSRPTTEAAPRAVEPEPVPAVAYARSNAIEHRWVGERNARISMSLCVSYSMPGGQSDLAAEIIRDNWPSAVEMARAICENSDLFDEQGRIAAEELLCDKLTEVLFAHSALAVSGRVERVIWNRLMWR